jgi:hypothetical protein
MNKYMSVIFFLFIIGILNNVDGINTQNQAAPQHANNQQAQHTATRAPIFVHNTKPKEEIVVRKNRLLPAQPSSGVWMTSSGIFHVDIECKLFVCNENESCGTVKRISLAENSTANCYEEFLPIDFVRNSHVAVGFLNPISSFIEPSNKITNTCRKFRM